MIPTLSKSEKPEAAQHSAFAPARFVALDLETGDASAEILGQAIARWLPPANFKDPDKIEDRRREAAEKTRERSALLDGSPIVCVAVRTDRSGLIFNGMDRKKYVVPHNEVLSLGNEKEMLRAQREWLDKVTIDDTVLVGFNLISFDLPRLRAAYMRHRLRLPRILAPRLLDDERQPVIDVMRLFIRYFTSEKHDAYGISLDEVIERLGLPRYKDRIDGSMVPGLVREGRVKEVLTYCGVDTMATLQAYLLMTSGASDMT